LQKLQDNSSKVSVLCINDDVAEVNSFNPNTYECKDYAAIACTCTCQQLLGIDCVSYVAHT